MIKGKAAFGDNPFRMHTEWAEFVVLPSAFIQELRRDPRLVFDEPAVDALGEFILIQNWTHLRGGNACSPSRSHQLNRSVTALALVRSAGEAKRSTDTNTWQDWHQITPREDITRIISRLSSRVFMGEELCRNEEWVRVSGDYSASAFPVARSVGQWPRRARPIVHWFLPSCWSVRCLLAECRRTWKPHLERRNGRKATALARGETEPLFDDSIEWYEKQCTTEYDTASKQITLSLVAIHITSYLLQQIMLDLASHPELSQPLREELVRVLSAEGLEKTAFHNLKLMDSVIK
ncbi:putative cytochrome P450 [Colletotrichum sublineola]|uniref:Putative cytochrome P450 n=1 Tax=Colletotrichum sublineola TaxID=1173701 RepID=A0A066X3B0_COLSU|nr:putative cytochrome P450 [Colletotrichum sublineola]